MSKNGVSKSWMEWSNLIVAVLGLGAGSGWGLYFVQRNDERHDRERADAQAVLHNFLEPLQFTLNHSRQLHDFLVADSDFNRLELTPSYLQAHFGSLPPSDPRRLAWKRMVRINREASAAAARGNSLGTALQTITLEDVRRSVTKDEK